MKLITAGGIVMMGFSRGLNMLAEIEDDSLSSDLTDASPSLAIKLKSPDLDSSSPHRDSLLQLLSTIDQKSSSTTDRSKSSTSSQSGVHATTKLSSSRRRYWGNNNNPCEETNPSDATDGDCYALRWSLMKTYYPMDQQLMEADRTVLVSEYGIEKTMGAQLNQLDVDINLVAGNDGTLLAPSAHDGLIFEAGLLNKGSAQLQRASIAAISTLYDSVMNVTQASINGTSSLKQNVASAYGNLMKLVQQALAAQDANAANNTQIASTVGAQALNQTVTAVAAQQDSVNSNIQSGLDVSSNATAALSASTQKLNNALSDATDMFGSVSNQVKQTTDGAANALANQLSDATSSILSESNDQSDNVQTQASGVSDSLKNQTASQIDTAKAQWSGAVATASQQGQDQVATVNANIDNTTSSFQNQLGSASSNATASIQSTQQQIQTSSNDAVNVAKDSSASAAKLSGTVGDNLQSAKDSAGSVSSSADNSVAEQKQQIANLLLAQQSSSGQSMQSILQALGGAQSDAQSSLSQTQLSSQQQVAQFLQQLGNDGTTVANLLGSLQQGIASGQQASVNQINQAFSVANSQTQTTQQQLSGQLDGIAGNIQNSQAAFAQGVGSLTQSMQSSISSGASTTASGLNSLSQTSVQQKQQLLNALMNSQAMVDTSASDFSDALDKLSSGLGSSNSGVSSANTALGATTDGMDNSLGVLSDGLGGSQSALADLIASQLGGSSKQLNSLGAGLSSQSSSAIAQLWSQYSAQLANRERQNDQVTSSSESAESSTMSKAQMLAQMASGLLQNSQQLVADGSSKSQLSADSFAAQLAQMQAKDNSTISSLQALLHSYTGDAMNDAGGFLASLISAKQSQISNTLGGQTSQMNQMNSQATASIAQQQKLANIVAALGTSSGSAQSDLINGVLEILSSTQQKADSFGDQIDALNDQLADVKKNSGDTLKNLTQQIQAEVMQIPLILTSGASQLQNDFDLASNDLQNNINVLKEKMATAQTDEEKQQAMQGLVVLEKMQAVQQGVADADAQLRDQIRQSAFNGVINSGNVQGAMASVLGAMSTLNSEMDTSRVAVQSDTETVGKQTATLVNGMNVMINQTTSQLANQAAQAAVASRFNLNMAQARTQVRSAAAINGVNNTLTKSSSENDSAFGHESDIRSNIDQLGNTISDSSTALGDQIDAVLNQVLSASQSVKTSATNSNSDVLTKLALVRMAMSKFLGLWNNYVLSMDRKFQNFHNADTNFLGLMENQIKHNLSGTESSVNSTSYQISGLKSQLDSATSAQKDYEDNFNSKIYDMKTMLTQINTGQSQANLANIGKINDLVNFGIQSNAQLKENINALINQFDDSVSNRVNQASAATNVASTSLLEKEIKALDAQVNDVL